MCKFGETLLRAHPAAAGADHASLAYVAADTGRIRWLARVPAATKLLASGDDVYLLTADRILGYRVSDLKTHRPR